MKTTAAYWLVLSPVDQKSPGSILHSGGTVSVQNKTGVNKTCTRGVPSKTKATRTWAGFPALISAAVVTWNYGGTNASYFGGMKMLQDITDLKNTSLFDCGRLYL